MSTLLRVAAAAVTLSLSTACGFFSLDDDAKKDSASHPEMGGSAGVGGAIATMGGTGGSVQGGTAGSAMAGTSPSSGGNGGAGPGGTGGTGGGSSGAAGAGAGMAGAAGAVMGGMAGDMATGGSAGMSGSAGMGGMAGSGPVTCESLAPGSKAHAGHCYLLVTNGANWGNAKKACSDKGAHLVTVSSESPLTQSDFDDENDFVFNELGGKKDTWIGLSDGHTDKESAADGEFKWVNDEPLTLLNWNDNEPNHYMKACMDGSDCWEHCVFMMTDPAGKWNDELCEMSKQYVCEWDMGG